MKSAPRSDGRGKSLSVDENAGRGKRPPSATTTTEGDGATSILARAIVAVPGPAPDIHCWWIDLAAAAHALALAPTWLSAAEHARAERFGPDALRRRWIAGRLALRHVLGAALDVAPAEVAIARGTRGRPFVDGADIDFNVTNTGQVGLVAVCAAPVRGARIGVDIERRDRPVDADRLGRRVLTGAERERLAVLDPDTRRRAFLRTWTCKEAMSKATGDGLSAPFRAIDVSVGETLVLVGGPFPYAPPAWSLSALDVPPDYVASLARHEPPD
jgi:4'-phosphopantetheinyl transferase